MHPQNNDVPPIRLGVIVQSGRIKNGVREPYIEVRREIHDPDLIKYILSSAYHELPILFLPQFNNRLRSISIMIENKIIIRTSKGLEYNI